VSFVSLRGLLHEPYLNLGTANDAAPFHVIGLSWAAENALDAKDHGFIQASVNASFREELATGSLSAYRIERMDDLPSDLQSERWAELSQRIADPTRLSSGDLHRCLLVVSRLGLHQQAVTILNSFRGPAIDDPMGPELEYLRAWCNLRLSLDDEDHPSDRESFARIAIESPKSIAKLDSTYQMVMQLAKFDRDLDGASLWQERHRLLLDQLKDDLDFPAWSRYMSRFHRVGAFLPQLQGDAEGVAEEMSAAAECAQAARTDDNEAALLADEMLYPCIESRMQEAKWLGDHELALSRANDYVAMRRTDPRGWMHLGDALAELEQFEDAAEAYAGAALYAPPGRSIALFMRGQCLEICGDDNAALESYCESIEHDPLATSALEAAEKLARTTGQSAVARWARDRLQSLSQTP